MSMTPENDAGANEADVLGELPHRPHSIRTMRILNLAILPEGPVGSWQLVRFALGVPRALFRCLCAVRVTLLVAAINAVIHLGVQGLGGDEALRSLKDMAASATPKVIQGEWWRLFTAGWIHEDDAHLFGNLRGMLAFGFILEPAIGSRWFALVFGSAILGGSAAQLAFGGHSSLGASDAVYGLMGALLIVPVSSVRWVSGLLWFAVLFISSSKLYLERESIDTSHEAHLGGLLAGVLVGSLIPVLRSAPVLRPSHKRIAAVGIAGLVVALTMATDSKWGAAWHASQARIHLALGDTLVASHHWHLVASLADQHRPVEADLIRSAARFRWSCEQDRSTAARLLERAAPTLNDALTYRALGHLQTYSEPRDLPSAEANFLAALRREPGSPMALNGLARCYLQSSDSLKFQAGLLHASQAVAIDDQRNPAYLRTLAMAHFYCDEDSAAVAVMRQAISLAGSNREECEADLAEILARIAENADGGVTSWSESPLELNPPPR